MDLREGMKQTKQKQNIAKMDSRSIYVQKYFVTMYVHYTNLYYVKKYRFLKTKTLLAKNPGVITVWMFVFFQKDSF